MTIHEILSRIKPSAPRSLGGVGEEFHFDKDGEVVEEGGLKWRKYFVSLAVLLLVALAFGIGRLSAGRGSQAGVSINFEPNLAAATQSGTNTTNNATAAIYASSRGSKYYFSNCKSTIVEQNKVFFASAAEAEAAGYTLASNCQKP